MKNEDDMNTTLSSDKTCKVCGAENSIKWDKKQVSIDDTHGSWKDLTFNFCEECGDTTNVELD